MFNIASKIMRVDGFYKVLLGCFLLSAFSVVGQINTPAPTVPLNSNSSYPNTTVLPTNTGATDATTAYNTWKSQYVANCGGTPVQYRVKFDDPSQTVSEGIGYGMLLAAYAGDQALFDGLYKYYQANSNGNGLMNWKIGGCSGASGTNGATDADEDAAMGLVIADYQWGTSGAAYGSYSYATEATKLVKAINKCEVDKNTSPNFQISNGDGWINCNSSGNTCRNPGYMAPAYYKCWANTAYLSGTAVTASWSTVESVAMTLVNANVSSKGLVTDWSSPAGAVNTCNGGVSGWGYDASRGPWRMAVYSAWYGNASAQTICNNVAASTLAAGPANVGGPVVPATNNPTGTHNATFVSMLAAGTFGSTSGTQTHINNMYTQLLGTVDAGAGTANPSGYFGNTLRTISIFFATGNFWNPCNPPNPVSCSKPNLGADVSTCGSGFPVTLNSNTNTATNVTFTWKRTTPSPTTITSASATAKTLSVTAAMGAGTYVVIRDSTGCTHNDTIVISSTLPTPSLGPDPAALCSTTFYDLTPSNAASFPGTTTWQWAVDYTGGTTYSNITGQTTTTLSNVRKAGRYKLTASISGCSSTADDIVITSNMPTPVDACISTAGNVGLSITAPLNGTNYNWYTTAAGSTLATVVSGSASNTTAITVHATATTTYYVQDMSAINTNVGPTVLIGASTDYAPSTAYQLAFTANQNFSINSLQIPFKVYSSNSATVTLEIVDGSGNPLVPAQTFTSNPVAVTTAMSDQLITFPFTGFNILSSWGPSLRMRISSVSNIGDPLWSNGTSAYPYNSTGSVVSITGIAGGPGGASTYNYFYNWNISTGAACNRLPVVVTVAAGCSAPAPVNLINFYAVNNKDNVLLSWSTASEQNNDYFNVERSVNGSEFIAIGQVKGAGNTNGATVYSFTDEEVSFGKILYRLAQYDFDGTLTYSNVIAVSNDNPITVSVAPNPFTTETDLIISSLISEKADIKVMDLTGRTVYQVSGNSNEKISLGSTLGTGVYLVQIFLQGSVQNFRIVKQ